VTNVLKTGRKWSAKKSVVEAKAALQIGDIVGKVQQRRGGLGLSLAPLKWHKAGGEDEVYKGHFPGQAGRVDEMGVCGTTQDGLARPLVNGRE